MRNLLFLLFGILGLNLKSQNQPWCHTGAVWTYYQSGGIASSYEGITEFKYTADVTISGINCKRISAYFTGRTFFLDAGTFVTNKFLRNYYTYMNNNVLYGNYTTTFDTIVDFNANIGDFWLNTRLICGNNFSREKVSVKDTGRIQINGQNLKKIVTAFTTTNSVPSPRTFTVTFIERLLNIGTLTNGPFPNYCLWQDNPSDYPFLRFRCYQDDNFQTNTSGLDCSDILGLDENSKMTEFRFYPNPAKNELHLVNCNQLKIEILNSIGQKLIEFTSYKENEAIHLNDLNAGIYFLQFTSIQKPNQQKFYKFAKE